MTYCALPGAFIFYVVCVRLMSALYEAYAEYLERMLDESDELSLVDEATIPEGVSLPLLEEWADVG